MSWQSLALQHSELTYMWSLSSSLFGAQHHKKIFFLLINVLSYSIIAIIFSRVVFQICCYVYQIIVYIKALASCIILNLINKLFFLFCEFFLFFIFCSFFFIISTCYPSLQISDLWHLSQLTIHLLSISTITIPTLQQNWVTVMVIRSATRESPLSLIYDGRTKSVTVDQLQRRSKIATGYIKFQKE